MARLQEHVRTTLCVRTRKETPLLHCSQAAFRLVSRLLLPSSVESELSRVQGGDCAE